MEKEKDMGRSEEIRMIWLAYIMFWWFFFFFSIIHSLESHAHMEIPFVLCEEFLPTQRKALC